MPWTIDTLDARGGLAFASWAGNYSSSSLSGEDREPPCIFIAAPNFRPEPIANYSIALAAGRGVFQTGLFANGVEVSFPTVEAVAEFVRRLYLRGGGGDGIDGGGGGDYPPPRPEDRPDFPRRPPLNSDNATGIGARIVKRITEFQNLALRVEVSNPQPFNWSDLSMQLSTSITPGTNDGPDLLASAGLSLIYEMARRIPATNDSFALARWQSHSHCLANLLLRLGLWPFLLTSPYLESLAQLGRSLSNSLPQSKTIDRTELGSNEEWAYFVLIVFLGIDVCSFDHIRELWHTTHCDYCLHRRAFGFPFAVPFSTDPIVDLMKIPLPERLELFIGTDLNDKASMYHALTAFLGSPSTILANGGQSLELVQLVLFAATSIVAPNMTFNGMTHFRTRPTHIAAIQLLAAKAWTWMEEQLPTLVFHTSLEEIIKSTANLRYA